MRTLFFIVVAINLWGNLFGQAFEFEKTIEIDKSQNELYSRSKSFIADYWRSAQDVIQNDDEDDGIIQVKAISKFEQGIGLGVKIIYVYDYSVRIRQKNNKCRIEVYDIFCSDVRQIGGTVGNIPCIEPFENEPLGKTKTMTGGISKKKAKAMMVDLKANMNDIVNSYERYISEPDDDF